MFLSTILSVLILIIISTSYTKADTANHILTEANFDQLTSSDAWLLEFFAPWCGHCKALAPVWERSANALMNTGTKLGSIDCTVEKALCQRFNVKGYPTIKFFRDGAVRTYQSGRTYDDIMKFSRAMLSPPIIAVRAESSISSLFDSAIDRQGSAFVFVGEDDDVVYPLFMKLALQMQGMTHFLQFAKPSKQFIQRFVPDGSTKSTPFILYYSSEVSPEIYQGSLTSLEDIRSFVEQRRLPIVSTLTGENFDDLTTGATQMNKKLAFYIFHPSNNTQLESFTSQIRPLAIKFRNRLLVTTVDAMKYSRWLTQFIDVTPNNLPTFLVFESFPDNLHKPATPGAQSIEQIKTMLVEVMENKRSSVSSVPWYSPQRYLRPMERYLNGFEEWQIIAGVLGFSAIIFGLLFWMCSTSDYQAETNESSEERVISKQDVRQTQTIIADSNDNSEDENDVKPATRQRKPNKST